MPAARLRSAPKPQNRDDRMIWLRNPSSAAAAQILVTRRMGSRLSLADSQPEAGGCPGVAFAHRQAFEGDPVGVWTRRTRILLANVEAESTCRVTMTACVSSLRPRRIAVDKWPNACGIAGRTLVEQVAEMGGCAQATKTSANRERFGCPSNGRSGPLAATSCSEPKISAPPCNNYIHSDGTACSGLTGLTLCRLVDRGAPVHLR